jgi:hypothetical protein
MRRATLLLLLLAAALPAAPKVCCRTMDDADRPRAAPLLRSSATHLRAELLGPQRVGDRRTR